ncbi:uncharacterized protein LAESUDRAFT_754570 [Laetiporus sulphureus 93-53]|uniref:Uncharacterized protein n=1 Tax=Laetiporus sulphureus 93-53 TaxID=1314785 RepID=A0A165HQK7_9APHY|nr:uncharacterized protein LAESUDRAFT_754570 [Laetiporus sulphureus 93-53]KZT12055.1 hypothetical protein LAESUDRAFT_754570 [Laetiporus sulphureus 93-53]
MPGQSTGMRAQNPGTTSVVTRTSPKSIALIYSEYVKLRRRAQILAALVQQGVASYPHRGGDSLLEIPGSAAAAGHLPSKLNELQTSNIADRPQSTTREFHAARWKRAKCKWRRKNPAQTILFLSPAPFANIRTPYITPNTTDPTAIHNFCAQGCEAPNSTSTTTASGTPLTALRAPGGWPLNPHMRHIGVRFLIAVDLFLVVARWSPIHRGVQISARWVELRRWWAIIVFIAVRIDRCGAYVCRRYTDPQAYAEQGGEGGGRRPSTAEA